MSSTLQFGQSESTWRGSSPSSRGANMSPLAQECRIPIAVADHHVQQPW